jgi:outer membrane autotransporter protein
LTVKGDVTFKTGSFYQYDINAGTKQSDLLDVDGYVHIEEGAELKIVRTTPAYPTQGDEFKVIAADQFNGQYFMLANTWLTVFSQEIRDDGYYITWTAATPDFPDPLNGFGSHNAKRAATAMNQIGAGSDIDELYNALGNMSAADPQGLADAFAQLHGEVFASNKVAAAQMQRQFLWQLPSAQTRLMCDNCCIGKWNRWATFTGDYFERRHIGSYSGYELQTAGVAFGADRHMKRNMMLGAAFGYDYAKQDFDSIRSQDKMDTFRSAIYSGWWHKRWFINGYAGYTWNHHMTQRNINIDNTFSAVAKSKYGDNVFSTGFEVGREFSFGITPSAGIHYIYVDSPNITETGGGVANLHVYSDGYESLRTPVGAKWNRSFEGKYGVVWTPEARVFYVFELADDSAAVRTSFDGVRGVSFLAESGTWGRHSGRIGLGFNAQVTDRIHFRFDYDCEVYSHTTTNTVAAALGVRW